MTRRRIFDDCFAHDGALLPAGEALARLRSAARPVVGTERVPLASAAGRILAEDLRAPADVPPFDNAAVDGWAIAHADLTSDAPTRLPVSGRSTAGHPTGAALPRGTAVRIFTGATVPPGTDTVVMQEDAEDAGETVVIPAGAKRFANLRRAGEDMRAGAIVLATGRRLGPAEIGAAAALGRARVRVRRRLRVALFSTGDELVEPGAPLGPGAINDANRHMLKALVAGIGCRVTDLGILRDDAETVRGALSAAAERHDAVLTSGGASTGEEDHVAAALDALGRIHAWRLAIKPGRPLALGRIGEAAFVGLPGNPVAAAVCFVRFARPLLLSLAGAAWEEPAAFRVPADFTMAKKPGRREWLRASLVPGPGGAPRARPFPREGSGILTSLTASDGLIELDEAVTAVAPGDLVPFLPFCTLGLAP